MSATPDAPFEIGQLFWLPVPHPRPVMVVCPICAGHKRVVVILGSGEQVSVDCDGCGLGYQGPQGQILEYEHEPIAQPFVVASVERYREPDEWYLHSTTNQSSYFKDLRATEAEALTDAAKRAESFALQQMDRRGYRKSGLKKAAWTVRYHRECIKEYERKIAWHRAHIEVAK
jgi:hypothetical protein